MNRTPHNTRQSQHRVTAVNAVIRYLIGGTLLSFIVASFMPMPEYIFAFSAGGLYVLMSALIRSEPATWQTQQKAARPAPAAERQARRRRGFAFPHHRDSLTTGSK